MPTAAASTAASSASSRRAATRATISCARSGRRSPRAWPGSAHEDPLRRGQRGQRLCRPGPAQPGRSYRAGGGGWRAGHRDGDRRASGPDPDGPRPAPARRLGGHPAPQGRARNQAHPGDRALRSRQAGRSGQGPGRRMRRLRHQARRLRAPARQDRGAPAPAPRMNDHLLVVDDNEDNLYTLTRRLKREGYEHIATAANGRDALEQIRAEPFDLVLLDVMMPEMNGYEVLAAIKADERLRHIPVIMISAVGEMESVIRCIEQGADD